MAIQDITALRRVQIEQETTAGFLHLVNAHAATSDLLRAAAAYFQERSGCQAVGIRLNQGDDYPYVEARGFPKEFVELDSHLVAAMPAAGCARQFRQSGRRVHVRNRDPGRTDPSEPFFTPGGSFWSNNTTDFVAGTLEAAVRCGCAIGVGGGYRSVALVPLRVGAQRLGLLQLSDRREGMFTPETVAEWEGLAGYLAVALGEPRRRKRPPGRPRS